MNEKDMHWLIGFIEGKGSFFINACKRDRGIGFQPTFKISLAEDDRETVYKIRNLLGFGKVAFKSNKSWRARGMMNPQNQYVYIITRIEDVRKFTKVFNENLFRTSKKEDFVLWKRASEIIYNYDHLSYNGFVKICDIRDKMNRKIKRKGYKNKKWFLEHVKKNKNFFLEKNIQKRKSESIGMRRFSKLLQ